MLRCVDATVFHAHRPAGGRGDLSDDLQRHEAPEAGRPRGRGACARRRRTLRGAGGGRLHAGLRRLLPKAGFTLWRGSRGFFWGFRTVFGRIEAVLSDQEPSFRLNTLLGLMSSKRKSRDSSHHAQGFKRNGHEPGAEIISWRWSCFVAFSSA